MHTAPPPVARLSGGVRRLDASTLLWFAVFSGVLGVLLALLRPWRGYAVGSDIGATVVYAQRIVAGARLEAFLGSTPKPLLSLVDGGVYLVTHDWRWIGALAIVAAATSTATWSVVVYRLTCSWAAAGFTAVALALAPGLYFDVGLAYTVTWLMAWLGLAALAATAPHPRWALAGVALAGASLCRQEALVLPAIATCIVVLAPIAERRGLRYRVPAGSLWLCAAWAAVPVSALHDWLLTGDPMYSIEVSGIVSAALRPPGVEAALQLLAKHLGASPLAIVLAVLGIVFLLRARQWVIATGILAIAGGVAAFITFLGLRHTVILDRYATPVDAAVLVAAAIGLGWITARLAQRAAAAWSGLARSVRAPFRAMLVACAGLAAGGIVALIVLPAVGPLDPAVSNQLSRERAAIVAFEGARPEISTAIATVPGVGAWPTMRDPHRYPAGPGLFLVSGRLYTIALADFALPITSALRLSAAPGTDARPAAAGSGLPRAGQVVYHDSRVDLGPSFDWLSVSGQIAAHGVVLTRLEPPPGPSYLLRVSAP
jgi:hypothetical protein